MTPPQSLVASSPGRARLAGALLVVGMLVFFAGSFAPVPVDYLGPVDEQFAAVGDDPTMWLLAHLLYVAGAALTAGGLIVLVDLFRAGTARRLAGAGAAIAILATLVLAVGSYYRVALPGGGGEPPALFVAAMGGWLYASYLVATLVGFAAVGAALYLGTRMRRLGLFAVGFSLLQLVAYALLGDLPPMGAYLVTAPVGVWLIRGAGREATPPDVADRGAGGQA